MKHILLCFSILLMSVFAKAQNEGSKVFSFVEQMPEYKGGQTAMMKFLQSNIQYPQMERDSDIQGKVVLRFVVMEDGKVDSVNVIKSVEEGLDSEAIRVVKMFPDFIPGRQDGKPVRVYYNLPVVFKLTYDNSKDISLKTTYTGNAILNDHAPEFPGGDGELIKFIQKNLRYPHKEKSEGVEGKVMVRFIVMEDGSASDTKIIRSISPAMDEEALRIISILPKFKPGTQEGKPVRVYFNLPVIFKLP